MSHRGLKQLTRAKQLVNEGNFDEALQLMKNFEEMGSQSLQELVQWHLLRCDILLQQDLFKDLSQLAEQTYKESLGLEKNLLAVDALNCFAEALIELNELEKGENQIKQSEQLLNSLTHETLRAFKQREAYLAWIKSLYYERKGDLNRAFDQGEYSLELREELGIKHEIALSLDQIAFWLIIYKGESDRALEYTERAMVLAKEANKRFYIALSLFCLALVFSFQGEIDRCIRLYEQSLAIFKELDNKRKIAVTLNNLGDEYRREGDLDRALKCLEESVALHQELGNLRDIATSHDYLIQILIDKGDLERAKLCLYDLEQLNSKIKNKKRNLWYLFDKALLLKTSPRARNRIKAEDIFNQLLEDKDSRQYELIIMTLLNLCELHLVELRVTNDTEVLDEINPLIVQLLDIAEKSHSYWVLSETYLLQAKLSLLTFDIKKTKRFLTKAQKIAESYGMKQLAMKISYEYDKLLKQTEIWKNLKETESSLSERWKYAGINEQIENMLKKRVIDVPEVSNEDPVLLLIVSEGGRALFSHSFIKEKSIDSEIFGGFLATIDYFIKELFSEGLDRAVFGEYTLLMKSMPPFFVSYIFGGDAYYANNKANLFIEQLQNKKEIWDTLLEAFQINQYVYLKDNPSLELLIKEIFIEKAFY
ncbi:MAG: tetratricopeptide repeat protein [Promethearchaeota archaeon]